MEGIPIPCNAQKTTLLFSYTEMTIISYHMDYIGNIIILIWLVVAYGQYQMVRLKCIIGYGS